MLKNLARGQIIKISITAVVVLAVTATVLVVVLKPSDNKVQPTEQAEVLGIIPDLPALEEIDPMTKPMLYDFVNGSLGWKYDADTTKFGYFYVLMFDNNKYPNQPFVSYYNYGETLLLPITGTLPYKQFYGGDSLEEAKSKVDKSRVFSEGDWTIYIISQYDDKGLTSENTSENAFDYASSEGWWNNVDLTSGSDQSGNMWHRIYDNGEGWPTSWVRKPEYVKPLSDYGYDVENKFWDEFNIESVVIYKRENNADNTLDTTLKVKVVQIDLFELAVKGKTIQVNQDALNILLAADGWTREEG